VSELNQQLSKFCLSSGAFGVVGISWIDLFPSDKENFLLGETDAERHSAVVSFGRYDAVRLGQHTDISAVDADLIWKMIKVCPRLYYMH